MIADSWSIYLTGIFILVTNIVIKISRRFQDLKAKVKNKEVSFVEESMFNGNGFRPEVEAKTENFVVNFLLSFSSEWSREEVQRVIGDRILTEKRLRCVLKDGKWVETDFVAENHIFMYSHSSEKEIEERVNYYCTKGIDLCRPLFEIHVFSCGQNESKVLIRILHTVGDGMHMIDLLSSLSTDAKGNAIGVKKAVAPSLPSTLLGKLLYCAEFVRSLLQVFMTSLKPFETDVPCLRPLSERKVLRYSGKRKALIWKPFPLSHINQIREAMKGKFTVNDVLLGAMCGVYQRYCQRYGRVQGDIILRALIPVFVPSQDCLMHGDSIRNSFAFASCELSGGVCAKDDVDRVVAAAEAMEGIKRSLFARASLWFSNVILPLLPEALNQHTITEVFSRHAVVFSNVIGPRETIYIGGKRLNSVYCLYNNVIDQVILISYDKLIFFAFMVDDSVWKHADELEGMYMDALHAMAADLGVKLPKTGME